MNNLRYFILFVYLYRLHKGLYYFYYSSYSDQEDIQRRGKIEEHRRNLSVNLKTQIIKG